MLGSMASAPVTVHLLVQGSGGDVLLGPDGAVPTCEPAIEDGERLVSALQRHLRGAWTVDPVILEAYLPPAVGGGAGRACLAILDSPAAGWTVPDGCRWGSNPSPLPAGLRVRAQTWRSEWAGGLKPPILRPRWSRPGWHARAVAWIDARLAELGRPRTGPVTLVRLWSLSAMMRAPTDVGSAWFKAVFPHFEQETRVTPLLAEHVTGLVPGVLASDPHEGWLLLEEAGTPPSRERVGDDLILGSFDQLSRAQEQLLSHSRGLEDAGCPRRPLAALADDLEQALGEWVELGGDPEPPARMSAIVGWVRATASWIDGLGWADTLIHGDFHPGNLLVGPGGTRIIDWSDAAISSPVVEMAPWMGQVRPGLRSAGWDAWLTALSRFGPARDLRDGQRSVYGIGCAYQIASYAGMLREVEPATRYQLADGLNGYWKDLAAAVRAST